MKRSVKTWFTLSVFLCLSIFILSLVSMKQPQEPWEVPAKFKTMKNPVANTEESINAGKLLYKKHCASCHGNTGLGDGVKAKQLETHPGDFSKDVYQSQTDGEQFYKTKTGRGEMPAYENKIIDEDIWHIINYMRTFKK